VKHKTNKITTAIQTQPK